MNLRALPYSNLVNAREKLWTDKEFVKMIDAEIERRHRKEREEEHRRMIVAFSNEGYDIVEDQ